MRYARSLARAALAALAIVTGGLGASAVAQSSPRALVYCPVGIDTGGCDNIVAALGGAGSVFSGGVDRGWDGTSGTVDLASADLTVYTVFLVPSLADGAAGRPYDRLRSAAVAGRLKTLITGRQAIWSGTPDLGTAGVAEKTTLLRSLTAWGAGGSGTGLVALLDGSDSTAQRYDWVAGISALAVVADSTPGSYAAVLPLTATGTAIVAPGGQALAYTNMAAFGLHAGSGTSQDAADSASTMPVLVTTSGAGPAAATTPAPTGLRALVYCPAADAGGCDNIVAALTAAGTPFAGGADRGYDGSTGTVDLRTADLSAYGVFVVPSLADGTGAQPYAVLRDPTVAGRLKPLLAGPVAVWSGTPDLGDSSRAQKNILITNLAKWAAGAAQATAGARGLVALQDASDSVPARYSWLSLISRVSLAADTTLDVYSNVQPLTPTAATLLNDGSGLQLGYTNMASFGLVPGAGLGSDAAGGRTSAIVLATSASVGGAGAGFATVTTDREDYQPGDTITVTGSGWSPGETVSLLFHEEVSPPIHPDKTLTAVADANGHILNHQYGVESTDLGVRFALIATGQTSGRTAQTTFTDANGSDLEMTKGHAGGFVVGSNASYTLTVLNSGNSNSSGTITVTDVLPGGLTYVSASGTNWSCSAAAQTVTCTTSQAIARKNAGTDGTSTAITLTVTPTLPGSITNTATAGGGGEPAGNVNALNTASDPTTVQAPTTTTVAAAPSSTVFGQSVTFTATVTPTAGGPATGTVTFKDGAATIGTGTLNGSGQASVSTAALTAGGHSITAVYNGGTFFLGSTSSALSFSVGQAGTTTAVASSLNPSAFGQSVTFTATVTAVAPGAGTPTGTVTFKDAAATLGSGTLNGSGQATFSTSALAVGGHSVTAVYAGDANFTTSTSAPLAQTVNVATTTTSVTTSGSPSVFGQSVTFTAAVTSGGSPVTAGSVTFYDGGSCAAPGPVLQSGVGLNASGNAAVATAALTVSGSPHTIVACYTGTASLGVSSGSVLQTVNLAATATGVASSQNPSNFGQSVTFTATVTVTAPGAGSPTGTVTFKDGAATLGSGSLSATAPFQATFATSALAAGGHSITAVYAGDGSFAGSTSATLTQTVNAAATTVTVGSSPNPSTFGQSVTLTATVTSGGNPVTVGSVSFIEGGTCAAPGTTLQAAGAVNASGQVTFVTSALAGGSHVITACYGGAGNFAAGNGSVTQAVNAAATVLTAAAASGTFGGTTTLSATLTVGVAPVSGRAITFKLNGTAVPGSATTNASGTASLANVSLSGINAGTYPAGASSGVEADFGGDASFASSAGAAGLTVSPAATTLKLTINAATVAYGGSLTLTGNLNPMLASQTISFDIGGTVVGTGTTNSGGVTNLSVNLASFPALGASPTPYTVTATFAPGSGGNFSGSSGTASLTITPASQTITFAPLPNRTFGDAPFALSATASSGLTVSFALGATSHDCTLSGTNNATVTLTGATGVGETCAIVASQAGNGNYNAAPAITQSFTVGKATPTVAVSGGPFTYDASPKAATATVTGVGAVSLSAAAVTFTYALQPGGTPSATAPANAGTYNVVATFPGDANYTQATGSGTIAIGKADQTITFAALPDRTFGDAPFAVAATASSGLAVALSVGATDNCTIGGSTVTLTGAGSCTVTAAQAGDPNYKPAPSVARPFAIGKATPTVAVSGGPFTYDGSPKAATATVTGLGGASLSAAAVTFTYALQPGGVPSATTPTNAGTYDVVATFPGDANYKQALGSGTLTIDKASATILLSGLSPTYDGTPRVVTAATTPSALATLTITYNGSTTAPTNAGSYAVEATLVNPNYAGHATGTLVVAQATPTVAVSGGPFNYDGSPKPATATVTGVGGASLSAAGVTFSYALQPGGVPAATAPTNAGTYDVVATFPGDVNYAQATGTGAITIKKAVAAIALGGLSQTYDGTPRVVTAATTPTGLTVVAITYAGSPTAPTDAGSYAIVAALDNQNYTGQASGTLVVARATPTVVAAGGTFPYDGAAHPATGSVTGINNVSLGTPSFSYNGSVAEPVNAGTYAVVASFPGNPNYEPGSATATIEIKPATPTIAWADPAAIAYGTALGAAQLNAAAHGVGGVTVSGTFAYSPAAGTVLHSGSRALGTDFTSSDPNYTNVTGAAAHITVNPAPLAATAESKSHTYGAGNPVFTAVYSGFVNGDGPSLVTGTPNLSTTATQSSGVAGSPYAIKWGTPIGVSAGPDYLIATTDGQLAVTPAPLTATADPATKAYGAPLPTFSATYGGFVLGETPAVLTGTLLFGTAATAASDVGTYPVTPSGVSSPNYLIAFGSGTLSVTPAALTVTAQDASRLYGDPNPAFAAAYSGFVLSQDASVLGGTLGFTSPAAPASDVGVYSVTPGGLTSTNYAITFKAGNLTITPAPLTITANAKSKVYGDDLPPLDGTIVGIKNGDPITATYAAGTGGQFNALSAVGVYPAVIVPTPVSSPKLADYTVTSVKGALTIVQATPTFKNLSSPTVVFGTATTLLGGDLTYVGNGGTTVSPAGGTVTVTLASGQPTSSFSATQTVAVGANGHFAASFATATVDVLGNPYAITYHFDNNESPDFFTAATNGTGGLTILDQTPPLVSNVLANPNPVPMNTATTVSALVSDAGRGSSTIASALVAITGGTISGTQTQQMVLGGSGYSRTATAPINLPTGVYSLCVTGTDAAGNTSAAVCTLLAVYDPTAGFATGGGWINSPAGAYTADPSLTGKANFGFVSKYQKGATVPTGDTEFQFQTAGLNFKSTSYDWLVISGGSKAQYKGAGTVNGASGYSFILTAINGSPDRFRIKITMAGGGLAYDNQLNAPDTSDPTTVLGGGSIMIHQ